MEKKTVKSVQAKRTGGVVREAAHEDLREGGVLLERGERLGRRRERGRQAVPVPAAARVGARRGASAGHRVRRPANANVHADAVHVHRGHELLLLREGHGHWDARVAAVAVQVVRGAGQQLVVREASDAQRGELKGRELRAARRGRVALQVGLLLRDAAELVLHSTQREVRVRSAVQIRREAESRHEML